MRLFVPFTNIQGATLICLLPYGEVGFTQLDAHEKAYPDYFRRRWSERQTFINIEHDIVFWDGALEELWHCPGEWCAFGYERNDYFHNSYPFGCVKFTQALIDKLPRAWTDIRPECDNWSSCDSYFAEYANERGIFAHPHSPSVVNANPGRVPHYKGLNNG